MNNFIIKNKRFLKALITGLVLAIFLPFVLHFIFPSIIPSTAVFIGFGALIGYSMRKVGRSVERRTYITASILTVFSILFTFSIYIFPNFSSIFSIVGIRILFQSILGSDFSMVRNVILYSISIVVSYRICEG